MKKNILILSCGGLTGVFLSKHLFVNHKSKYNLIGCDIEDSISTKQWLNSFYKVPKINEPEYLKIIKEIIEKENIHCLIPVTSYDVKFYKKISSSDLKTNFITINNDLGEILDHKEKCYNFLNKLGINTPKLFNDKTAEFPCIVKPKIGSGSKNTFICKNHKELDFFLKTDISFISDYIPGEEYTVDCYFNTKGICIGFNVRKRNKTVSGGATISQNCPLINVENIIKKLEENTIITGPVNFQFKIYNEQIYIFDFNTRLASGGLSLTVKSGFDIPNILIQDSLYNNQNQKWTIPQKNQNLKLIKYYEEYYE